MKRLMFAAILFVYACLFAGAYGAFHNQISYTVASEYFTKFKFHQFVIPDGYRNRTGAAIVGWMASWWMGLVIGSVLIPLGFLIPKSKSYFWSMIAVFWIVVLTTLIVGLGALAAAYLLVDPNTVGEFTRYNNEIVDDAAFLRAGTMHDFSYLGGLVGIVTGSLTIFWMRRKAIREASTELETT